MSPAPSLGERERRRRQNPNPANYGRRATTSDGTAAADNVPCSTALHRSRRVHLLHDPECAVIPLDGISSLLWKGRCSFHGHLGFTTLTGSPFTDREDPHTGAASDDFSPKELRGMRGEAARTKSHRRVAQIPFAAIAEHRVFFY
ncbi:hypothetical protein U1Q18_036750 [Sarracenia purpurea var. burkii]